MVSHAPRPLHPRASYVVLRYPAGIGEYGQVQMPLRTNWCYQPPTPLQPLRS